MKSPVLFCFLLVMLLLSACAPAPAPTQTPTHTPTQVPATPTATPEAGSSPCPTDYVSRVDTRMGFSACYPVGWAFTEFEDPENQMKRINFIAPASASSTRSELKFISVSVVPRSGESSDEALLKTIAKWLDEEYPQGLITSAVWVDEQEAIEVTHEGTLILGREVLEVTRWMTVFVADDQEWEIEVAGRSDYRQELEQVHDQFLARFHILPR